MTFYDPNMRFTTMICSCSCFVDVCGLRRCLLALPVRWTTSYRSEIIACRTWQRWKFHSLVRHVALRTTVRRSVARQRDAQALTGNRAQVRNVPSHFSRLHLRIHPVLGAVAAAAHATQRWAENWIGHVNDNEYSITLALRAAHLCSLQQSPYEFAQVWSTYQIQSS